jgi:hypothetical protein
MVIAAGWLGALPALAGQTSVSVTVPSGTGPAPAPIPASGAPGPLGGLPKTGLDGLSAPAGMLMLMCAAVLLLVTVSRERSGAS